MRKMVAVAGFSLALAACQSPGGAAPGDIGVNNTTGGTLVGAGLGGLLGNQFGGGAGKGVATLVGVLAGGFLGSQVGKSLDEADVLCQPLDAERSQQRRVGSAGGVAQPDSGHQGTIVPQPAYQQDGTYCREFQQTITVGGQTQDAYGKACRQPDGSWKIVQ